MATTRRSYKLGNYDLRVARSYAGLGLFTDSDIPKGQCIVEYTGRILGPGEDDDVSGRYLFEVHSRRTIDGTPRSNTARYINHSCKPNCEPMIHKGRVFIFSKRAIKAGEELSYNYGKAYVDAYIKPHGCLCPKCRPATLAKKRRAASKAL
ncbi:MAG TPA: SET domain-containing protein [Caulobacterales bacterium]|nr:SET domain-containing protein [Caulobacterales bacterium]